MFPIINVKETGINLRRIIDKRDITVKDVQQYLGLSSVQSVYHWLNGISMPTIDNLYALSQLLCVPIDAIVRGNRTSMIPECIPLISEPQDGRLFTYYKKLNEKCVA